MPVNYSIMKSRAVFFFWLSFVSLIFSLVVFASGFIGVGAILLIIGLFTSYAYQSEYADQT